MDDQQCPNCGQRMEPHRQDRQRVGRRTVELVWSMCANCRHVGLTRWRYEDTPPVEPKFEVERVPRRERSPGRRSLRLHGLSSAAMCAE